MVEESMGLEYETRRHSGRITPDCASSRPPSGRITPGSPSMAPMAAVEYVLNKTRCRDGPHRWRFKGELLQRPAECQAWILAFEFNYWDPDFFIES